MKLFIPAEFGSKAQKVWISGYPKPVEKDPSVQLGVGMDKEKALQLSSLVPGWNFPIPIKSLLTKNVDSSFSITFFFTAKIPLL